MARQRRASTGSSHSTNPPPGTSSSSSVGNNNDSNDGGQEMASMYDYLAKIILLGPSGSGKSCLLHRFVKDEWRMLSSQTIGVEFASRIVKVGTTPGRRKRVKLQLWDTAGTERFRSVSRSYYRGAAGALLIYDIASLQSFAQLPTFLNDARALASPQLAVVLAGNKLDLEEAPMGEQSQQQEEDEIVGDETQFGSSVSSVLGAARLGSQQRATVAENGRAVQTSIAANWASQNRIPAALEVSALSGDGVEEIFNRLARTILTKIELGEIDPDDPMSGIQYGDADYYRYDDGSSIKSGLVSDGWNSTRRRRRRGGWGEVFKVGPGRGGGKCC